VIVWTAIGAAPPMTTPPTLTGIALRRMTGDVIAAARELAGGEELDVEEADQGRERQQGDQSETLEVELGVPVERPLPQQLDQHDHHASPVEGEERQKVREPERDRQERDEEDVGVRAQ